MKKTTSIRITAEARALLLKLAERWGISQSAVLELIIRRIAEQEGLR